MSRLQRILQGLACEVIESTTYGTDWDDADGNENAYQGDFPFERALHDGLESLSRDELSCLIRCEATQQVLGGLVVQEAFRSEIHPSWTKAFLILGKTEERQREAINEPRAEGSENYGFKKNALSDHSEFSKMLEADRKKRHVKKAKRKIANTPNAQRPSPPSTLGPESEKPD